MNSLKKPLGALFAITLLVIASTVFAENTSPTAMSSAAIQMTLAGIAYVDDAKSLVEIKAAIVTELGKAAYATRGTWELVWGPAVAGGNLAYVVHNKADPKQYSVVIRGTDFNLLGDDIEDIWVEQVRYPYASNAGRPRVSRGSLTGLHHIQRMTDAATGRELTLFSGQFRA